MFTAHDLITDAQICPPVFSEPIHNMKSAATNDLKICRMSRTYGKPRGGDDVFILVEKVNKKNIEIRFFELSDDGQEVWSEKAKFLQSDVHHQYAIVFRTPQYKEPKTPVDVKVYIELVRPSNGWTSESKEFTYKAEQVFKQNKKRKNMSSYSSIGSSSDGSIRSIGLPAPVATYNLQQNHNGVDEDMNELTMYNAHNQMFVNSNVGTDPDLANALFTEATDTKTETHLMEIGVSPMLSQPNVPMIPQISLNSAEFQRILRANPSMTQDERQRISEIDFSEYFRESYGLSADDALSDPVTSNYPMAESKFGVDRFGESRTASAEIRSQLFADSGRQKGHVETKKAKLEENKKEYNAVYTNEDGNEVKQLVKDICEMIRKKNTKKQDVKVKLERLFELRLSNGDTFLHMTLSNNQPSLDAIVKIIHNMKMTRLLNLTNHLQQSILHLAIMHDNPRLVKLLVAKGCDPMLRDVEYNTLIHFAVNCQTCLEPLLESIKSNNVPCDLDAQNNDKHSALHVAVICNSPTSVRLLLQHGAKYSSVDSEGRTPLHLAVLNERLEVVRVLMEFVTDGDIDMVDSRGYTALQMVCDVSGSKEVTLEMLKLLLQKKANPLKLEGYSRSAWKMVQDRPDMVDVIKAYLPQDFIYDDDVKSEPEDEYESADEGDEGGIPEMSLYLHELSEALDATEAWRELAKRLHHDSLLNWYENTVSPTRTLLTQIKECDDNITSKSLVMILEEIGQKDAANIIKKYI